MLNKTTLAASTIGSGSVQNQTDTSAKVAAQKTSKKANFKAFATDEIEGLKTSGLAVHSAKAAKISGPDIPNATVLSEFPLNDLSQVKTDGRWAQGFRLDGGSLRLMWMNVRRTKEQDGTAGFEVFFQAQGPAIDNYKKRLEQAGATSGNFKFFDSDVEEIQPGKAVLKKTGSSWGPSSQQTLTLEEPGKWSVDYVTSSPEALKGSFRIRLLGSDSDATAALQDIVKKLGLHALFAPPAPNALERFKLLRFMWQVLPGAADHLRFKPLSMLEEGLKDAVEHANLNADSEKAIADLKLEAPEMKERVQLAELLYEKSPTAFLDWTVSQHSDLNGMMLGPNASNANQSLKSSLNSLGIAVDSDAMKAAIAKEADVDKARPLFLLSLLAKNDRTAADAVVARDIERVKLPELEAALAAAGIDPKGDRVKNLRFEEVYPGYFTVIDPSLSGELAKAGARYLYSTSDNAERVWQMLTGGQKSSMTRFQEGVLIQGKSSDHDFRTGGAFSVFSRLVTDSIIRKAKAEGTEAAGDSDSPTAFHDWYGSRPFKLIINRRALDRTDWYGYNRDSYGRSTGLTKENHGERIVNTINSDFSMSNEVMFPVGNDPSYVDYIVAPTAGKKKELVDFLSSKGITEFNGKKVDDFVIVKTKLFEHPDDMTLSNAVADAVMANGFSTEITAALDEAKKAAEVALNQKLAPIAKEMMAKEGAQEIKSQATYYASSSATAAAQAALNAKPDALAGLGLDGLAEAASKGAVEASIKQAKEYLENTGYYYQYDIDTEISDAVNPKIDKDTVEEIISSALAKFVAEYPAPTEDTTEVRSQICEKLRAAIYASLAEYSAQAAKNEGTEAGTAKIVEMVGVDVLESIRDNVQYAAQAAVGAAAIMALPSEPMKALTAVLVEKTIQAGAVMLLSTIKFSAQSWLEYVTKSKIKPQAQELATELIAEGAASKAKEATKDALGAVIKKTQAEYVAANHTKAGPAEVAEVRGAVEAVMNGLIAAAVKSTATQLATEQTNAIFGTVLKDATEGPIFEQVAKELIADQATTAVQRTLQNSIQSAIILKNPNLVPEAVKLGCAAAAEAAKAKMVAHLLGPALDRTAESLTAKWWYEHVDGEKLAALQKQGLDQIMTKLTPPPPPLD